MTWLNSKNRYLFGVISLLAFSSAFANNDTDNSQFTATKDALVNLLTGTAEENGGATPEETIVSNAFNQEDDSQYISKDDLNSLLEMSSDKQRLFIAELLDQSANPLGLVQELIKLQVLDLSPKEIKFVRNMADLKLEAQNSPLATPEVRSGAVKFDSKNRYKTYEFYVHDSGVTALEFYDANGQRWPIVHETEVNDFSLSRGFYNNTLLIEAVTPYKAAFSYISLEGYPNPIAIKITYKRRVRDGIRTFHIPFIYKVKSDGSSSKATYSPMTAIKADDGKGGNGSKIPDIDYQELLYLASVGHFDEDKPSSEFAVPVLVDQPQIASIWRYGTKFIIRSRFQLMSHQYETYVPSTDGVFVYVAKELDTAISFNVNGNTQDVLIPDYHLF